MVYFFFKKNPPKYTVYILVYNKYQHNTRMRYFCVVQTHAMPVYLITDLPKGIAA